MWLLNFFFLYFFVLFHFASNVNVLCLQGKRNNFHSTLIIHYVNLPAMVLPIQCFLHVHCTYIFLLFIFFFFIRLLFDISIQFRKTTMMKQGMLFYAFFFIFVPHVPRFIQNFHCFPFRSRIALFHTGMFCVSV